MLMAKKIQRITSRDREVFRALANTGFATKKNLVSYCEVELKRLNKLEKSGLIERQQGLVGREKSLSTAYKLTSKGRDYVKENLFIKYPYTCQSFRHDLALSEEYFKRFEDRVFWITERQLLEEYKSRYQGSYSKSYELKENLASPCDAAIIKDGNIEMIEVITRNYTEEQIASKQNFASSMDSDCLLIRV